MSSKSRWDKLKGKVPRVFSGERDAPFLEKVAQEKERLAPLMGVTELATHFAGLREQKEGLEAQVRELNVGLEATGQLLVDRLETLGLRTAETDTGKKLTVRTEVYPSVADGERILAYLREHPDLDYLRKVHPASLGAYVRDLLENPQPGSPEFVLSPEGGQFPELGVQVYLKTTIGVKEEA